MLTVSSDINNAQSTLQKSDLSLTLARISLNLLMTQQKTVPKFKKYLDSSSEIVHSHVLKMNSSRYAQEMIFDSLLNKK